MVQGDWTAMIGEDAGKNWNGICDQYCNPETNERGLRLLELAIFKNLKAVNTFGPHTNYLDAGHGTVQEENTTIRLTTSWPSNAFSQVLALHRK